MSSVLKRFMATYLADGTITKGQAVKIGSDKSHVAKCTASTDRAVGIAQHDALVGESLEVAHPGGGGYAQAGGTIAAGDLLGFNTDGDLVKVAAQHDIIIAQALESAVDNDIFGVQVIGPSMATQTQS